MHAILTYHSIDPSGSVISLDRAAFMHHVAWLASGRVNVVPLESLLASTAPNAVALTFDDGFRNFAEVAWPLLADHGFPATLFVVSDFVGSINGWSQTGAAVPELPLLDWDEIGRLAEEGVTVGAHTRRHPDLRGCPPGVLEEELGGARAEIARRTGREPEAIAYPYGGTDRTVRAAAARLYRVGCTTRLACVNREDPLLLPRLDAWYFRQSGRLEAWGTASFRRYLWVRAGARRVRQLLAG